MRIIEAINKLIKEREIKCQDCEVEHYDLALKALEKQIPQWVEVDDCCRNCRTYCKNANGVAGGYCPNCGQKLKWD